MGRRLDYKPWPLEAKEPHTEIVKRQVAIAEMINISIQEGIEGHNKEVVKRLSPLIHQRAREMQAYCRDILTMRERERTGRNPKWFTITQDIQNKALYISGLIETEITPSLKRNEMVYIGKVLKRLKVEAQEVKSLLEENPYRSEPEIWKEVREVLKDKAR